MPSMAVARKERHYLPMFGMHGATPEKIELKDTATEKRSSVLVRGERKRRGLLKTCNHR